jgi:hypothetical protein
VVLAVAVAVAVVVEAAAVVGLAEEFLVLGVPVVALALHLAYH